MKTTIQLNIEFAAQKFIDFFFTPNENPEWLRIVSKTSDSNMYNINEIINRASEFCQNAECTTKYANYISVENGMPVLYIKFFEQF